MMLFSRYPVCVVHAQSKEVVIRDRLRDSSSIYVFLFMLVLSCTVCPTSVICVYSSVPIVFRYMYADTCIVLVSPVAVISDRPP